MIVDTVLNDRVDNSFSSRRPSGRSIPQAQETIYSFLLDIVKTWEPTDVLEEFKRLFINHVETVSSTTVPAVYELIFANDQTEFIHTLKRSCYILINNWETRREHQAIKDLVLLFTDPLIQRRTSSPTLRRLRTWLSVFITSQDYEDLKLFAARYEDKPVQAKHWSERYTSYLLVSQFVDADNPVEQREAARALAQKLKDKFKFDLAMYTAKSQSPTVLAGVGIPENPTGLGDETIRLIKMIVMRRGVFSYTNLANIFLKQTAGIRYQSFKRSFLKYLTFALPQENIVHTIHSMLAEQLNILYFDHHEEEISDALLLRTCNRVIEYLTTEDRQTPSPLFCVLLSNGNPLPLVSILLKLILICRNSRTHLEARIADLVRYYQNSPEDDCQWVINFFEVFNITFTIYTENIEYNIVPPQETGADDDAPQFISQEGPNAYKQTKLTADLLETYRIFSQLRHQALPAEWALEEDLGTAAIAPPAVETDRPITESDPTDL